MCGIGLVHSLLPCGTPHSPASDNEDGNDRVEEDERRCRASAVASTPAYSFSGDARRASDAPPQPLPPPSSLSLRHSDWNDRLSAALANRGPDLPRRRYDAAPPPPDDGYKEDGDAGDSAPAKLLSLHASVLHMRGLEPTAQPLLRRIPSAAKVVRRRRGGIEEKGGGGCSEGSEGRVGTEVKAGEDTEEEGADGVEGESVVALCWNGECYAYHRQGDSRRVELTFNDDDGPAAGEANKNQGDGSDTVLVMDLLASAVTNARRLSTGEEESGVQDWDEKYYGEFSATLPGDARREHEAVAEAIGRIQGEYAFIFYVPGASPLMSGCAYYGRDFLGRRSLLSHRLKHGHGMVLSSVAAAPCADGGASGEEWKEIPPGVVYRMDASTGEVSSLPTPRGTHLKYCDKDAAADWGPSIADERGTDTIGAGEGASAADQLLVLLERAVRRRISRAPPPHLPFALSRGIPGAGADDGAPSRVAVLFSGGLDSVVLAALCHRHVPSDESIDLINVSFYDDSLQSKPSQGASAAPFPPPSPDRLAAERSHREMRSRWPERRWRFVAVDVPNREVSRWEARVLQLIAPLNTTMDFNIAAAFWFAGRGKGALLGVDDDGGGGEQRKEERGRKERERGEGALQDQEQQLRRSGCKERCYRNRHLLCVRPGCNRCAPFSTPDCVFGACRFCCGKYRKSICSFLGRDAGLCAWLCPAHGTASTVHAVGISTKRHIGGSVVGEKGGGKEGGGAAVIAASSAAKILLSGVGADEQMAGYGRHRTVFARGGYKAVRAELQMETARLWTRNLGRDDRCLSDHGKEARFPYLDDDVVSFLRVLPVEYKCDFSRPPGIGDKLILREVARKIGVFECSSLVKRAIQFGSRIAKADKSRFGSQRRATGCATYISTS